MFSFDLPIEQGVLLLTIISFTLAIILSTKKGFGNNKLFMIRFAHFFTQSFMLLYPFVFMQQYDLLYISFGFFMAAHWLFFKGECILSYLEKKELDNNYAMGQDIYSHPYFDDLIGRNGMFILNVLNTTVITYVMYRYFVPICKWSIIFIIMNAIYNFWLIFKRYA